MYGLPSLQMVILIVTAPILIAFFVVNRYQTWESVVAFLAIVINTMFATVNHFTYMYYDWKRDDVPVTKPDEPLKYKNLNTEYQATTTRVNVNVEQKFAKVIMDMWRTGIKIDFTETYWIKKGNWQDIGGGGRSDFVDLLGRWELAGAIRRKNSNKNSPYVIANKGRVVAAAGGRQL